MSTEPVRIEFALQNDPRLLEGARTIFAHAAKQVELPNESRQEFSVAALEKCREAFVMAEEKGRPDSAIHLLVSEFPDRVEISIEYPGDLRPRVSALSGPECAGGNKAAGSAFDKQIFDSVEGQSLNGSSRLKVIKYVGAGKLKTKAR
jgi:anti-sigma regulatory factor (Ser/Thr protein kinase)